MVRLLFPLNLCTIQAEAIWYKLTLNAPEKQKGLQGMDARRLTQPNILLRQQRQLRGWSLQHVADQLCKLGETEDRIPGVTADMVGKWERGEKKPSPFYREKLCTLYSTTADELGFIEVPEKKIKPEVELPIIHNGLPLFPNPHVIQHASLNSPAINALIYSENDTSEVLESTLLSLSSKQLAHLTNLGWTSQDIIAALQVILQGEAVMAKMNRRQILQLGAGMFLSGIALPHHEHPSAEERTQLSDAIGESIAASWTLFQNANNMQVLAVGQAQLTLLQQAHHTLYPSIRPMHYSGVYRLIGGALHFQDRYDEARQAHEKSYIAALEGGDLWNMAQSLSWQADGFKAQKEYSAALETIEGALRLMSQQDNLEAIRLRAHLLASGAEVAAYTGDSKVVQAKLAASEMLLQDLPPHEEFDAANWHQLAGTCALILEQYDEAITHLEHALKELPPQWILRQATALMPLALAYARKQERDSSLSIAQKASVAVNTINSPGLSRQFVGYIQQELLGSFPTDTHIHAFVSDTQQRLLPATATAR